MRAGKTAIMILVCWNLFGHFPLAEAAQSHPWKITHPTWTAADEDRFSLFVQKLGRAVENHQCDNVTDCLRSTANIDPDVDAFEKFFADCGKLPYLLRGYFAWKEGLPFSMVDHVQPRNGDDRADPTMRYNSGNIVTGRTDPVASFDPTHPKETIYPDAYEILKKWIGVEGLVYTATYRTDPAADPTEGEVPITIGGVHMARNVSDFYSVSLDRQGIRPGVAVYDPSGHVLMVYDVLADGTIKLFDAHPGNWVGPAVVFDQTISCAYWREYGWGFKAFRNQTLVGATQLANGEYVGGKIYLTLNQDLPHYSLEQYQGQKRDQQKELCGYFPYKGKMLEFYDYLQAKLATNAAVDPVDLVKEKVNELCSALQSRTDPVEQARTAKFYLKPEPDKLPQNIYGTEGTWETFSTASRDARIKFQFRELYDQVDELLSKKRANDPSVDFKGTLTEMQQAMLGAYQSAATGCKIDYTDSNGRDQSLSFTDAQDRLFGMSFDYYHCPELRWGDPGASKIPACVKEAVNFSWYEAERRLRNETERSDAPMGFTLQQLQARAPNSGEDQAPEIDVRKLLKGQ